MESNQDVDALGKSRDKNAEDKDFAKKQSDKEPAAENLDMMPNSVNKEGTKEFDPSSKEKPDGYADAKHKRADARGDHAPKEDRS